MKVVGDHNSCKRSPSCYEAQGNEDTGTGLRLAVNRGGICTEDAADGNDGDV